MMPRRSFFAVLLASFAPWSARAQREESIARLTPTIPTRPMTGKEIATALVAELDKVTRESFGVNGTRSKTLERM